MRSEKEMLDLILTTAREDHRIRAVIMNGSRVNPKVPKDIFQDFDIVYVVTDVAPFRFDRSWVDRFGERIIMQMPEEMMDPQPKGNGTFTYLMQFTDGNRIDLGLYPVAKAGELVRDSLRVLLLDKDDIFEPFPAPSDTGYLPKAPDAKRFADCCNEFWWVCPYVAKGLWRDELPYAKFMLERVLRDQLTRMLTWYVGSNTGFTVSPGKFGKYFSKYLEPELWVMLLKTYPDADPENVWQALFTMGELFRKAALLVAGHFGFTYPLGDEERVTAHLRHVKTLPRDAEQVY